MVQKFKRTSMEKKIMTNQMRDFVTKLKKRKLKKAERVFRTEN